MESMGYFQEKDEKQSIQQSRRAEGSIVPQQCHRLIASMPHFTDAGVTFIYIYAFSRRFYPKRLTLHSSYSFLHFISSEKSALPSLERLHFKIYIQVHLKKLEYCEKVHYF